MMKNDLQNKDGRSASGLNTLASEALPLLKRILGRKGMVSADILMFWEQIAGEELAAYTTPEKIVFKNGSRQNGVFYVSVLGGAFALELQHREKFVLEKINAYFGYNAVNGLRIRQGSCMPGQRSCRLNQPEVKKILVSKEEQNYIEKLTGGLEAVPLKESLVRLGKSILSQNRNEQEQ